jgi:uncharacterized protein with PIN domain
MAALATELAAEPLYKYQPAKYAGRALILSVHEDRSNGAQAEQTVAQELLELLGYAVETVSDPTKEEATAALRNYRGGECRLGRLRFECGVYHGARSRRQGVLQKGAKRSITTYRNETPRPLRDAEHHQLRRP